MSDKAAEVIADAVRDHLGFHDCPTDENDCCADIILAALKAAGIALVDGFTEEWRYEGHDEKGGWVSAEVFEEKPNPRWAAYDGGKLVARLVGPWREVSDE